MEQTLWDGSKRRYYIYTEHGCKNQSGGLGQLHIEDKVVHHFEVPEAGERDYVQILDLYFSKLPKAAFEFLKRIILMFVCANPNSHGSAVSQSERTNSLQWSEPCAH